MFINSVNTYSPCCFVHWPLTLRDQFS